MTTPSIRGRNYRGPQHHVRAQREKCEQVRTAADAEYVHGWCGPDGDGVAWAMVAIECMNPHLTVGQVLEISVQPNRQQRKSRYGAAYLARATLMWNGSTQILPHSHTRGGFSINTEDLRWSTKNQRWYYQRPDGVASSEVTA